MTLRRVEPVQQKREAQPQQYGQPPYQSQQYAPQTYQQQQTQPAQPQLSWLEIDIVKESSNRDTAIYEIVKRTGVQASQVRGELTQQLYEDIKSGKVSWDSLNNTPLDGAKGFAKSLAYGLVDYHEEGAKHYAGRFAAGFGGAAIGFLVGYAAAGTLITGPTYQGFPICFGVVTPLGGLIIGALAADWLYKKTFGID